MKSCRITAGKNTPRRQNLTRTVMDFLGDSRMSKTSKTLLLFLAMAFSFAGMGLFSKTVLAESWRLAQATSDEAVELEFWRSVKDTNSPDELRAYLRAFPNGKFRPLAEIRLKKLESRNKAKIPTTGANGTPVVSPQPTRIPDSTPIRSPELIREAQGWLYNLNYPISRADGRLGPETKRALAMYHKNVKLPWGQELTYGTLRRMRKAKLPTKWAAVAYSSRGTYKAVWNVFTRREAERRVLAPCRRKAGKKCRLLTAADSSCISVAHYKGRRWQGSFAVLRGKLEDARALAMRNCIENRKETSPCRIIVSVCGDGSHKNRI